MLSRQLPTRPLPVAPVSIGYCGRNRRFVLRIYFHIEQSLEPHLYFTRTPYPLLSQGFCVCELVAAGARNFRATSAIHGRGHGQSTGLMQPGTGRGRELSMSANNPCSRSVHANNHSREQSRFAHRQRPQSSVDRQRQRTRNVRRQSAVVNCPRPRMRHERNPSMSGDW